ncbi:GNAT family N-acetyltransferase [Ruegeria arenilitoris]|uniref:GNAT family N-acetyltransferase n=1 Tax=Ruegeria arenilitoris TaxID=1173585 RepID=UPI00147AAC6E|nr:GNAT family N-acetyltransferase [Ruegeria arenilitoris]
MGRYDIRRATEADVPACAAVVSAWVRQTEWMTDELPQEELEALIAQAFPDREMWVVGEPVDCYMSVDPAARKVGALYCQRTGQGIGKRLLDRAKQGRSFLWLTAHQPNAAAQRFYRREGFVETGTEAATPPETVPVVRMEWHA